LPPFLPQSSQGGKWGGGFGSNLPLSTPEALGHGGGVSGLQAAPQIKRSTITRVLKGYYKISSY